MNNPITEGAVFKHNWIKWKEMLPLKKYDKLVLYIDPAWKGTSKNCYKAAKLWGKTGSELLTFFGLTRFFEMGSLSIAL